ncbi:transcription termination/antitermination protein NusG [Microbacterium sp.]|uniref:transcription termination/antitermination protein NusG n=1 Tax=Microbacterium sp. TaxID=51671 RepID=UPI003A953172
MSERYADDVDWATAAEQSSEDDEAQEGNVLKAEESAVEAAERVALHVEDEDSDSDDDSNDDDAYDIDDPEADAIVNDALHIDQTAEAEAAAEVLTDDAAEDAAQRAAAAADEVAPYDGPDVNGEEDRPVLDDEFVEEVDAAAAVVDDAEQAEADDAETDDEAEPEEEDPYESFRAELRTLPGKWYVIHSYAGFERKVKANIEQRKSTLEVEEDIYQIEVPMEDVVEIKNGQRKMVTRVRIPGYVLVRMELNEDTWSVVRHTPGVTGFVGNAHNPTPLRFEEAFNMLKSLVDVREVATPKAGGTKGGPAAARVIPAEVDFEIGETITIKEGSFAGLPGTISEIQPASGKLTVLVSLFERETPVELSFDQVTKMI